MAGCSGLAGWLLWLGWLWLSVPSAAAAFAAPLAGPTRALCRNRSQYVMPWFTNNDVLVCKSCAWPSSQASELQLGFSNEVSLRLSNLWVNRFLEMAWQLVAVLVLTEFWGFSEVCHGYPGLNGNAKFVLFLPVVWLNKLDIGSMHATRKGLKWSPNGGNKKTRDP